MLVLFVLKASSSLAEVKLHFYTHWLKIIPGESTAEGLKELVDEGGRVQMATLDSIG